MPPDPIQGVMIRGREGEGKGMEGKGMGTDHYALGGVGGIPIGNPTLALYRHFASSCV